MKKLYVAILSKGWWRSEMFYLLNDMAATHGIKVVLRNPKKSWAVPISNNRNIICKEFLETDCDFLLMIDNDVVPSSNPALLVFADKDVVSFPVKIRQKDKMLNWNAYIKHPEKNEFAPVDFDRIDKTIDLVCLNEKGMAAVGTGCILIKRQTLEKIQKPFFMELFDDDGIVVEGEDFSFSRKVHNAGLKIYITPQRRCEHFHEVGLYETMNYEDSDGFFTRRENLQGKKAIIGCGAGRCGTMSLATLLNYQDAINCTHEKYIFDWNYNYEQFVILFPKLFFRNNYGKIPADVASWYLPYVKFIIDKLKIDVRIICLIRDFEQMKNSMLKTWANTNNFTDTFSCYWDKTQDGNSIHRNCYPKFDVEKEKAIEMYIQQYYDLAVVLQENYKDNFRIFQVDSLNSNDGIRDILDFVGIPSKNMKIVKVHKNKSEVL